MSQPVNQLALSAAADEQAREKLITDQEQMILRMASKVCRRYVSKSDDEWSVALCAFSRAIDRYTEERGDFLPFAAMLIKHDLIDYYRAEHGENENTISLSALDRPGRSAEEVITAASAPVGDVSENALKIEIEAANDMLQQYGFRFFDLTECSPRQDKTREQCALAVRTVLHEPILLAELQQKKKLPIRVLASRSQVPRKTLDRYRKYIIMAVLVLEGDYPHIAEYLKFMRKEDIR